jgi:hypothetical protein
VVKDEAPANKEFNKVGICNFDFANTTEPSPSSSDPRGKRINLLSLLIHLWPGNWQQPLKQLNRLIQLENEEGRRLMRNGRRVKIIRKITEREFWVWWGIVIAARIEGRTGTMWDQTGPEGYGKKVDMGKYMLEHRFKKIQELIPYLFADESRKENDPWWQFSKAVNDYNKNRSETVLASFLKLMDESMSAYRPQTTKTGNLDHLQWLPESI